MFTLRGDEAYKDIFPLDGGETTTIHVETSIALPPKVISDILIEGPLASLQATVDTGKGKASETVEWNITEPCDLKAAVQINSTTTDPSVQISEPCP